MPSYLCFLGLFNRKQSYQVSPESGLHEDELDLRVQVGITPNAPGNYEIIKDQTSYEEIFDGKPNPIRLYLKLPFLMKLNSNKTLPSNVLSVHPDHQHVPLKRMSGKYKFIMIQNAWGDQYVLFRAADADESQWFSLREYFDFYRFNTYFFDAGIKFSGELLFDKGRLLSWHFTNMRSNKRIPEVSIETYEKIRLPMTKSMLSELIAPKQFTIFSTLSTSTLSSRSQASLDDTSSITPR